MIHLSKQLIHDCIDHLKSKFKLLAELKYESVRKRNQIYNKIKIHQDDTLQSSLTQWLYSEVSYSRKLDQTFAHEKSNDDISPV